MKTRVLAYLRVSTATQLEGDGFDRQLSGCSAFAEKRSWEIARVFREQQSGSDSTFDRPRLTEAMGLCTEATGIDTILIERIDRLGRDLIVCELFFRECKKLGIKVYAADSGEEMVDAEGDPTRKLIRQVLGALAEWNRSELVKKLQGGRRATAKATGKPCGGLYPFGAHPNHERCQSELLTLQYITALRSSGYSWNEMVAYLNKLGFLNPSGKLGWVKSSVCTVFRNSIKLRATLEPLEPGKLEL